MRGMALVLMLLLAACGGTPRPPDRESAATATEYSKEELAALTAGWGAGADWGQPRVWPVAREVACRAEWFQTCRHTFWVVAPTGWQLCRLTYAAAPGSATMEAQTAATRFLPESDLRKPEPDRYHPWAYRVALKLPGTHRRSQPEARTATWRDVGVLLLPASAMPADRDAAGCDIGERR